jgi:peptidoglycan/LPS O-acetylase OafA/YrhL
MAGQLHEHFQLGYRPCLDGMRGFAIITVITFHGNVPFLQGGFIGVDIFFVLSGFLITSLLIQEWEQNGSISLKHFYIRRALRLLPALLALLGVYGVVSFLTQPKELAVDNYLDALVALFYSANWTRAFNLVRSDGLHRPDLLGHTWSLSIEEQFYLLWPLLLIGMLRLSLSRRSMVYLIGCGILLAWLSRAVMYAQGATIERLYNGLDTRADALLMGALLAVASSSGLMPQARVAVTVIKYAAIISLLGLLSLGVLADWRHPLMYYVFLSLISFFSASLTLYLITQEKGVLKKIFELPSLIWIGQISYGLYLWHYPIFRLIELQHWSWHQGFLVGVIGSLTVASWSYYLLERPILQRKKRFQAISQNDHTHLAVAV